MEITAALVGLGGTIAGAAIALASAHQVASREQRTRDIDRAIEMRLGVYVEFAHTANVALAAHGSRGTLDPAVTDRFLAAFERLRLVASPEVEAIATQVHREFGVLLQHPADVSSEARAETAAAMNRTIAEFVAAARADLRRPDVPR